MNCPSACLALRYSGRISHTIDIEFLIVWYYFILVHLCAESVCQAEFQMLIYVLHCSCRHYTDHHRGQMISLFVLSPQDEILNLSRVKPTINLVFAASPLRTHHSGVRAVALSHGNVC